MKCTALVICASALLLFAAVSTADAASERNNWLSGPVDLSRYHTISQLIKEFKALSKKCETKMTVTVSSKGKHHLHKIEISSSTSQPSDRVLFFFGEHARELISPESSLELAHHLCGQRPETAKQAARIMAKASVVMFPVINVWGRRRVEKGYYCVRTNEHHIDLNRNWGDHWENDVGKSSIIARQSFGGRGPYSETETQILKKEATALKPTVFLTIHSGTLGLYTPYAYNGVLPKGKSARRMLKIVTDLNKQYCNCDAGPAGKEVGYLCPGTCLDFMYDVLKTRYAYGFEIFDGFDGYRRSEDSLLETEEKPQGRLSRVVFPSGAMQFKDTNTNEWLPTDHAPATESEQHVEALSGLRNSALLEETRSTLRGMLHSRGARRGVPRHRRPGKAISTNSTFPSPRTSRARHCLAQFNPVDSAKFEKTLNHWSIIFLNVLEQSMQEEKKK